MNTTSIIISISTFFVIYILDYFLILLPKYNIISGKSKPKKRKKNKKVVISEVQFLQTRFKLKQDRMDIKYMIRWIAFLNAFIIAFTSTVITYIPWDMAWQLLVGFVLLFGLIYALYELFGRLLVKKGWNE